MTWETVKQPTQRDWYLCKVNGQKLPLLYNVKNNFWTGVDGKVYNNVEWLDDENYLSGLTVTEYKGSSLNNLTIVSVIKIL